MKASYIIDRIEGITYYIKNNSDGKIHEAKLVTPAEGKAEFTGLPNHLNAFVFNFTEKDIYESPEDVLNVLITMYDSKGDAGANIVNQLPRDSKFIEILADHA